MTCACARRIAALDDAQSQQPSQRSTETQAVNRHSQSKQTGLSKKDAALSERLQKLKDATKPGFTHVSYNVFVADSYKLLVIVLLYMLHCNDMCIVYYYYY